MNYPTTIRYTVAAAPEECFRMLDVVADGTVRCRRPASIAVEFIRLERVHFWCEECFDDLWKGVPSAAEIFDRGEVLQ